MGRPRWPQVASREGGLAGAPTNPREIERAAVEQPAWGQARVSEALKQRDLLLSPAAVRRVWQRHDLTSI